MRNEDLWVIVPAAATGSVGIAAFVFVSDAFTGSLWTCYFTAIFCCIGALATLGSYLVLHEISAKHALFGLSAQALALILVFAGIYRGFGLKAGTEVIQPLVDRDISLYFSIVTWTTLGYGDYAPTRGIELIAALEALLGLIFLGLLVGLGTSFLLKAGNKKP